MLQHRGRSCVAYLAHVVLFVCHHSHLLTQAMVQHSLLWHQYTSCSHPTLRSHISTPTRRQPWPDTPLPSSPPALSQLADVVIVQAAEAGGAGHAVTLLQALLQQQHLGWL